MPVDPDMCRWVPASIFNYVKNNPNGLVHQFQGDDKLPATTDNFCEWRLTTPDVTDQTLIETDEQYVLDCLVSADNSADAYRIQRNVGLVMSMFIDFQIYRLGANNPPDDQSLVGCLTRRRQVKSRFFGQIGPKIGVVQTAVYATYCLNYEQG